MGKPDKREMQRRRARAEVESALGKGRIADAADALLALPIEERADFLPTISARAASLLSTRTGSPDVATRLAWLSRLQREPRLLPAGEPGMRARWTLFQAALQAKQWPPLARLLEALQPALATSPWRAQLEALVAGREAPAPQLFASATDDDERLGYDVPVRATYAAPERLEDVERACLRCFGLETWPRFRDVVTSWLARKLPDDIARALRVLSALLSQRELIVRTSQPRAALEVAQFCATLASTCSTPAELEPVVALSLRAAARALVGSVDDKARIEATTKVVAAALAYPGLAPLVERIVSGAHYENAAYHAAERMLRAVAATRPSIVVALAMADMLRRRIEQEGDDDASLRPEWMVDCFAELLEREPARVAEAFAERARTLSPGHAIGALDLMTVPVSARALEVLWDRLPEPRMRELLARSGEHLLVRMRMFSAKAGGKLPPLERLRGILGAMGCPDIDDMSDAEVHQVLRSMPPRVRSQVMAMVDEDSANTPLSGPYRETWRQLSGNLTPYRPSTLEASLELTSDARARRALVDRFWAHRPGLLARLEALMQCVREDREETLMALEKRLDKHLGVLTQLEAARALELIERTDAPVRLRNLVSRLLLAQVEADGAVVADPYVEGAVRRARRYTTRRTMKAKAKAKTKAREAPRRQRRAMEPLELFRNALEPLHDR